MGRIQNQITSHAAHSSANKKPFRVGVLDAYEVGPLLKPLNPTVPTWFHDMFKKVRASVVLGFRNARMARPIDIYPLDREICKPPPYDQVDPTVEMRVYDAWSGELPKALDECDGYVISGRWVANQA